MDRVRRGHGAGSPGQLPTLNPTHLDAWITELKAREKSRKKSYLLWLGRTQERNLITALLS